MSKPKKCKVCGKEFQPIRSTTEKVCGFDCAVEFAYQERVKRERKEHRERKLAVKPRSKWLREAQSVFNLFVRRRDASEPCISCGRFHTGQYHAGHYLSVGARPELRFEPLNVHKQCAPCNDHLSGNIALYRINLIKKIGLEKVEWLEGPHDPKKYTIEELKEIKAYYTKLAKEIESANPEKK